MATQVSHLDKNEILGKSRVWNNDCVIMKFSAVAESEIISASYLQRKYFICEAYFITKWFHPTVRADFIEKDLPKQVFFLVEVTGLSSQLSNSPPDCSPKFSQQSVARQIWSFVSSLVTLPRKNRPWWAVISVVEVTGLEPAASCSQSKHSSQTELHLEMFIFFALLFYNN